MRHPVQKGEGVWQADGWKILFADMFYQGRGLAQGTSNQGPAIVPGHPVIWSGWKYPWRRVLSIFGSWAEWKVAARNFTTHQEGCPAPSAAAATVNPSIASGEHPARDTLDPSQSVAEGWGQKRGEIPVSGKQRCWGDPIPEQTQLLIRIRLGHTDSVTVAQRRLLLFF